MHKFLQQPSTDESLELKALQNWVGLNAILGIFFLMVVLRFCKITFEMQI